MALHILGLYILYILRISYLYWYLYKVWKGHLVFETYSYGPRIWDIFEGGNHNHGTERQPSYLEFPRRIPRTIHKWRKYPKYYFLRYSPTSSVVVLNSEPLMYDPTNLHSIVCICCSTVVTISLPLTAVRHTNRAHACARRYIPVQHCSAAAAVRCFCKSSSNYSKQQQQQ